MCFWQHPIKATITCPEASLRDAVALPVEFERMAMSGDLIVGIGYDECWTIPADLSAGWTERTIPHPGENAHNICWTGSRFVAAGNWDSDHKTMYSDDGITWTAGGDIPTPTRYWQDAAANANAIVVAGETTAARSTDGGVTWAQVSLPVTSTWFHVEASPDAFMMTRNGSSNSHVLMSDSSGGSWAEKTLPISRSWYGLAWNGSVWIISDTGGTALTSPDGTTWTSRTIPSGGSAINNIEGLSDGTIVAIREDGTTTISINDGATWTDGEDFDFTGLIEYGSTSSGIRYAALTMEDAAGFVRAVS